jgi:hypothetical protein
MLDLDKELNALLIPFKNLYWVKAPAYPYGIYDDVVLIRGNDEKLTIVEHDTTIELYSGRLDEKSEGLIETWLNNKNYEFKKTRIWIDSEKHYSTIYEFSFIEKKGE